MPRVPAVTLPNDRRANGGFIRSLARPFLSVAVGLAFCSAASAQMCLARPALGGAGIDNVTATVGSGLQAGLTVGETYFLSAGAHYQKLDGVGGSSSNTNLIVSAGRSLTTGRAGLHVCPTAAVTYLLPVEAIGISTSTLGIQPGVEVGYEIEASPGGLEIVPMASVSFVLASRTSSDGEAIGKVTDWGGASEPLFAVGAGVFLNDKISIAPALEFRLSGGGTSLVVNASFGLGS